MSLRDYRTTETTTFRGPWTALEESDTPQEGALYAQNVEYQPGAVKTRYGFGQLLNPNEPIWSMFNWVTTPGTISTSGNWLFYINPTTAYAKAYWNIASPSGSEPYSLFNQTNMVAASWASGGTRVYAAPLKSDGTSAGQCRVISTYGAAINVDKAFIGPVTATPVVTEPSTGDVTAGLHRLGFIVLTRTGHFGSISSQHEFTAAGSKNIQIVYTPSGAWPTEAAAVYPVMTTAANLNRWFLVPSAYVAVPGGSSFAATVTISVSDDDLSAVGTDVTDNLSLMTQNESGVGPFDPTVVLEVNNRMGYIHTHEGVSQIAISEPEKPQHITSDQHVLTLPGQRQMVTGFMLPNGLYLLGPSWTYYTSDNGEVPVLWPVMQLVDGQIGTQSPRGVAANSSQGYAWVASQRGLERFEGGVYASRPVSYYVSDWWRRINWSAGVHVEVVDEPHAHRVRVKVPLDTATTANYLFTFDYSNGVSPEMIAFSADYIGSFNIGAIAVGKSPTTGRLELWLSRATAGKILRQKNSADASPYDDDSAAIDSIYETSLTPPKVDAGQVRSFHGAHFRVKGSGSMAVTAYGIDRTKNTASTAITLSTTPGQEPLRQWYLTSEAQSVRVRTNAAGSYFALSALKQYWKEWVSRR